MTQETIDIADAVIPVPGPVVAAVRKLLGRLPYDDVQQLPAQIDAALQRWGSAEIQRRAAAAEQADVSEPAPSSDTSPTPEDPPTAT